MCVPQWSMTIPQLLRRQKSFVTRQKYGLRESAQLIKSSAHSQTKMPSLRSAATDSPAIYHKDVSLVFTSWNRISQWLRHVDGLRTAA